MLSAQPAQPHPPLSWWGWGDPALVPELSPEVLSLLRDGLGVQTPAPAPASQDEVVLIPARLPDQLAARLGAVVGEGNHAGDHESRLRHALGKSTPDLLALRPAASGADHPLPAPDLVLSPGSHDEILELLQIASHERVAVVPFGGGTSVVGGLTPQVDQFAGWVALDLQRLNRLISVDEESRLAVMEPGLRGPQAEALLGERGYTIGHFPQSYEYATLGGFAAARSSGQASAGYGRFDERVLGMQVATPAGTLKLGRAPRSAAGPDLRQLLLGSEGAFGVITSLTLQVRPMPEQRLYEGWRLPSFTAGARVLRRLVQDGPAPTVLRLSDEAETALNLARPAGLGSEATRGGCLAIIGFEGTADEVRRCRAGAQQVLTAAGGTLEPDAGDAWAHDRYRGPYLRDALLNAGALVETLETVGFWSAIPALYAAVSQALRDALSEQGTPPVILCHISHVYPAGASLYFTVGAAAAQDPRSQWHAAKVAASEAILASGGSISHHHGIGTDHLPWFRREIGELGMAALGAVKHQLDPAGVLNPGILIQGGGESEL